MKIKPLGQMYYVPESMELQIKINKMYADDRAKLEKCLSFIKKVNTGYCLSDSKMERLKKLVDYENDAYELLQELGEV